MAEISGYSKVFQLGHYMIAGLLEGPVVIEEKIDGSQFSFANLGGELHCRSRGGKIDLDNVPSLFGPAVATAKRLFTEGKLPDGRVFRCETLHRPKHNVLCYDRVPSGNLYLFDVEVQIGTQTFMDPAQKQCMAEAMGIEPVRLLALGECTEPLSYMLDGTSVLGGCKIEGFVIKNYSLFTEDGKLACGKVVSQAFKEMHRKEWTPVTRDSVEHELASRYCTDARWAKAVQHLAEAGSIKGGPEDIGALMKEVHRDLLEECGEDMAKELLAYHRKSIMKLATNGLPAWYKERIGMSNG